ncbi:LmbE family N-acetylglucosaminyl deacetylase [Paenarthrobacter nitroguajacolicus]|uniref:PIG-L deacetylase family protein n=1 Tax=Paenarthrobacter nitroguajacolicus TaxID=211146 RepID=UPI002854D7E7|nr:PIG-L family deacetylase [Paenarthrobacter nitroguajacolicus]MDR6985811.1 LmbE family N-acetylglucosaminyl deacetylase [Paenarthrobacter nitroguajacolicus]
MSPHSRIDRSLSGDAPWLFLSPHLDDAVLSCGALMEAQARGREVIAATLFTEASPGPHTRAARSFLGQCAVKDAGELFDARKAEDMSVLADMGIRSIHLGAVDALFRQRKVPKFGSGAWDRLLPEITHRYPTYRFDIALGRIAGGDRPLITQLRIDVAALMGLTGAELLFCPVGVGRHVDHLITREAGMSQRDSLVLYSDFPYDLTAEPDGTRLAQWGYVPWSWDQGLAAKPPRIRQYATQADALFPSGEIPVKPETYFVPAF